MDKEINNLNMKIVYLSETNKVEIEGKKWAAIDDDFQESVS